MNTRKNHESSALHTPRLAGEILHEYLENSNEPLAVAYRQHKAEAEADPDQLFKDIFPHTELAVSLKFLTHKPGRIPVDSFLHGVITRDSEEHYTFVEDADKAKSARRTPVIWRGECVNVHLLADRGKRLAFTHPRFEDAKSFHNFCLAAASELLMIARLLGREGSEE